MFIYKSLNLDTLKKLERKAINLTEIALEKKVFSGKCDYQKFLIICRKRTGSNFLVSLLQSHPKIRAFGEVFSEDDQIYWGYPSYSSPKILQIRQNAPIEFLDRVVFRDFLKSTKAVGFKLIYQENQNENYKIIYDYLRDVKNLKIIHLQRKNILSNYVSLKIAQKTDVWIKIRGESINDLKLKINYEDCLNYFQQTRALEKKHEVLFSHKSQQIYNVYYEDLITNKFQAIENLQKFLGIECLPLISYTKKQEKRLLSEIIINYNELKKKFENTPWHSFFHEY
jgi:LPS sulfotransferase NodH